MSNTPFYIAKRYLIAKKENTAVTFITWLAAVAMMVAVAAMLIIVSVFSGLEDLNREIMANLHADLTVKSNQGKTLTNIKKVKKILSEDSQIAHFSAVIEEKVSVEHQGKGDIAFLRGVDSAYTKVNPINKDVYYGKYPSFEYANEVLMEDQLDIRLALPVDTGQDFASLYIPKAGEGLISKEDDIFNKKEIFVSGVFPGKDQLNNYIIAPIELAQQLLELPKNSAYQFVIKLKNPEQASKVKAELLKKLGKNYDITTQSEENTAFWKMINTEKLFIYLIFALVIFITTFNLAGAIVILQLDKKEQAKSLISLGLPIKQLRKTYFYTGLLIVFFGIASGLILGTIACVLQLNTGLIKANDVLPFPVKIVPINYLLVCTVAAIFGLIVSWFFSKINKETIAHQ